MQDASQRPPHSCTEDAFKNRQGRGHGEPRDVTSPFTISCSNSINYNRDDVGCTTTETNGAILINGKRCASADATLDVYPSCTLPDAANDCAENDAACSYETEFTTAEVLVYRLFNTSPSILMERHRRGRPLLVLLNIALSALLFDLLALAIFGLGTNWRRLYIAFLVLFLLSNLAAVYFNVQLRLSEVLKGKLYVGSETVFVLSGSALCIHAVIAAEASMPFQDRLTFIVLLALMCATKIWQVMWMGLEKAQEAKALPELVWMWFIRTCRMVDAMTDSAFAASFFHSTQDAGCLRGSSHACVQQRAVLAIILVSAVGDYMISVLFVFGVVSSLGRYHTAVHCISLCFELCIFAGTVVAYLQGQESPSGAAFLTLSVAFTLISFVGNVVGLRGMLAYAQRTLGSGQESSKTNPGAVHPLSEGHAKKLLPVRDDAASGAALPEMR